VHWRSEEYVRDGPLQVDVQVDVFVTSKARIEGVARAKRRTNIAMVGLLVDKEGNEVEL
jgi:hypothetical protein